MMKGNCVFIFLILVSYIYAGIYPYEDYNLPPWQGDLTRVAIWSFEETPSGYDLPFVHINYTFRQLDENAEGRIQAMFFPSREKYIADFALIFLNKKQDCSVLTNLPNLGIGLSDTLYYRHFDYPNKREDSDVFGRFDEKFDITESAVWYLYFFNCQSKSSPHGVYISGTSEWKNSYGYLDGGDYPLLVFAASLCVAYVVTIFVWSFISIMRRKNVLVLQRCCGILLVLGLAEALFLYLTLYKYNVDGLETDSMPFWAVMRVMAGVIKQTVSRILVLVVMLGYSTARVSLSRPTIIFMLGTCIGYGVSCLAYSMVKIAPSLRGLSALTTEIVQFPGVMFNLVCFGWFFVAAYNTMQGLREHKQMWKVEKFHQFSIILGISLFLGILATVAKGTALILQWDDIWWQVWWMWDAFWYSLYFITLVAGTWLWRPLPDNTVYHLTEEMRQEQTREEAPHDSASDDEARASLPAPSVPTGTSPTPTSTHDSDRVSNNNSDQSDSDREERDVKLEVTKSRRGVDESDPDDVYFYRSSDGDETEVLVL